MDLLQEIRGLGQKVQRAYKYRDGFIKVWSCDLDKTTPIHIEEGVTITVFHVFR